MVDNDRGGISPCLIEDLFRLLGYMVVKNGRDDPPDQVQVMLKPEEVRYFVRRLRLVTHNKPRNSWVTFIYDRRNRDLVDIKVYEIDSNGNKRSQSVISKEAHGQGRA